MLWIKAKISKR